MKIVDQFSDPTLAVLARLVMGRPKVAAEIAETEIEPDTATALPDTAFAWPEKRAFPIHSREHTIISRVYRENLPAVPEYVDTALKQASEMYNVDETLFERTKQAAVIDDPEDYLLPDIKRLKVTCAEQVKVAEEKLINGYQKLSVEHRALACRRLLEKAAAYNVRLNPLMHKLAGYTMTSTQNLKDWIEARSEAAPAPYKEAFQKLAAAVKKLPAELRDRATQVKIAETITELDRRAGLSRHYGRRLPDPLQTVFNTEKVAGHGVDLNGTFVPTMRLAAYPATFYADVLGDDVVREAGDGRGGVDPWKLAAILETLPRDMKGILAQQIR